MNRISVSVLLLLLVVNQVFAMSPINTLVIKDAQEYGRRQATQNYAKFITPWTAFEEKAQQLSELTEHAHIFTPYVIVAADARERSLRNEAVLVENSEKALAQYDGYLMFSVNLYTSEPASLDKITAKLIQEKQDIPAYYIRPSTNSSLDINGKSFVSAQFYLYFVDKAVRRQLPLTLQVTDSKNRSRSFFFDLSKVL